MDFDQWLEIFWFVSYSLYPFVLDYYSSSCCCCCCSCSSFFSILKLYSSNNKKNEEKYRIYFWYICSSLFCNDCFYLCTRKQPDQRLFICCIKKGASICFGRVHFSWNRIAKIYLAVNNGFYLHTRACVCVRCTMYVNRSVKRNKSLNEKSIWFTCFNTHTHAQSGRAMSIRVKLQFPWKHTFFFDWKLLRSHKYSYSTQATVAAIFLGYRIHLLLWWWFGQPNWNYLNTCAFSYDDFLEAKRKHDMNEFNFNTHFIISPGIGFKEILFFFLFFFCYKCTAVMRHIAHCPPRPFCRSVVRLFVCTFYRFSFVRCRWFSHRWKKKTNKCTITIRFVVVVILFRLFSFFFAFVCFEIQNRFLLKCYYQSHYTLLYQIMLITFLFINYFYDCSLIEYIIRSTTMKKKA